MIKRAQYEIVKNRLEEHVRFIQVIFGPRQVGKTTLIKQVLTEINLPSHYVTADAISAPDGAWIEQQWETARLRKKQLQTNEFILVIDEIQKIKNWSEYVKAQWDYDRFHNITIKLVILGSSSLLIQKGLGESLTGRFEQNLMMHWSYNEMSNAFGFTPEQYVWFGGYPGSAPLISDEDRWKLYVSDALIEPTILKDILMLTRIDKPALLRNLFELACSYSGQILSLSKILGQLDDAGNTTTLAHYLKLLDGAGLVSGISKLYSEENRRKASIPKLQVYNTAFLTVQNSESYSEIITKPEKWGRHVESAVGAHLLNFSRIENFRVLYWRHRNDEMDFVIERKGKLIGLEVKSGKRQHAPGLKVFRDKFKPDKTILIGISGIPWQEFLKFNPVEMF